MQFITLLDYVLLPFYFGAIFFIARGFRNRNYPEGHPWRSYFIPALSAKMIGAIFIGMIYQYYYGTGDTALYYKQSSVLFEAFLNSVGKWLQLILHLPTDYDGNFIEYTSRMQWYTDTHTYAIISIAGFFSIFTFNTYLPTALLFSVLSFSGMWAMFRTFSKQYQR